LAQVPSCSWQMAAWQGSSGWGHSPCPNAMEQTPAGEHVPAAQDALAEVFRYLWRHVSLGCAGSTTQALEALQMPLARLQSGWSVLQGAPTLALNAHWLFSHTSGVQGPGNPAGANGAQSSALLQQLSTGVKAHLLVSVLQDPLTQGLAVVQSLSWLQQLGMEELAHWKLLQMPGWQGSASGQSALTWQQLGVAL
jgi:hypothetical protein